VGKFDADMEKSQFVQEVLEGLSKNTQLNYKASLRQFLRFVNSKEGLSEEVHACTVKVYRYKCPFCDALTRKPIEEEIRECMHFSLEDQP